MEPLFIKIFDVDFYMCSPVQNLDVTFSQFRGSAVHQVPVIRIFGSTAEGKKICVHIHGIFPYFYIPYDGKEPANGLMYKIASNLDRAINISLGQTSSNNQHVYKMSLVSGMPFYGYHSRKHQFFKVYLYNPMFIKRANNLLFNESVLGMLYQPHETHLNFTLQFMIDYNLHGMSNILLLEVKFRKEVILLDYDENAEETLTKVSSCELECDTLGEHIVNRKEIESGNLAANPGIAALWEDEQQRRRNKNEDSQLPHYLSLDKTNVTPTESHEIFKRALQERLAVLSEESEKNEFNLSVYPAECPRNKRLTNCSYIDFHSPQNSQSNFSTDSDFDQTLTNETLNITIDQDVQDLIDVLKDLEKNVTAEDDSILSQVSKNEEEEEDHDMTISLESNSNLLDETLKISQLCADISENEESGHESSTDNRGTLRKSIKIPQLDGHSQDFETFSSIHSIQTAKVDHSKHSCLRMRDSRIANKSELLMNKNFLQKYDDDKLKTAVVNLEPLSISEKYAQPEIKSQNERSKRSVTNHQLEKYDKILKTKNYSKTEVKKEKEVKKKVIEETPGIISCGNQNLIVKLKKLSDSLLNISKVNENNKYAYSAVKTEKSKSNIVQNEENRPNLLDDKKCMNRFEVNRRNNITCKSATDNLFPIDLSTYNRKNKIKILIDTQLKKIEDPNYSQKLIEKPEEHILFCEKSSERKVVVKDKIIRNVSSQRKVEDLLEKKHAYFCANFIGERVAKKNQFRRRKISLKNQLEVCRGCVVLLENLHLPKKNGNKRNMPSLTNDWFSSDSDNEPRKPKIRNLFTKVKGLDDQRSEDFLSKLKRTIRRARYIRKETRNIYSNRRFILAQKICMKSSKCFNMLEAGSKPVFRIVPGYRPYVFKDKRSNKNDTNSGVCHTIFDQTPVSFSTTSYPTKSIREIIAAQKRNEAQFFNSLNSMFENYSINETKLLENEIDKKHQIAKLVEMKKQMLFLDGANDSCSDEEVEKKNGTRSRKKNKTTYSSLPIIRQSSMSLASGIPQPVTDQINSRMRANDDFNIIPAATKSAVCDNIQKIKRKISFEFNFQDKTIIEEELACATKPVKRPEYLENHKLDIIDLFRKKCPEESNNDLKDKISICDKRSNISNTKIQNGTERDDDISNRKTGIPTTFSDHTAEEEDYLSTSALYDIINDYQPQEGTSKCYVNKIASPKTLEFSQGSKDFEDVPHMSGVMSDDACENTLSSEFTQDQNYIEKVITNEEIPINNKTATEFIQLSGSSSDIFIQEIPEQLTQKSGSSNNLLYYKPLYKPPTRNDVEQSMSDFGIPRIRAQEPFYSNADDFKGGLEVGYNVLKIRTLTSADAHDFESSFEGIDSMRKKFFPKAIDQSYSNAKENHKYSYCKVGNCVVTPVRKPPTRKEVQKWLKEKSLHSEVTTKSKPKKNKIYILSSQDGCSDDSLDLSLTLTPSTPQRSNDSPVLTTPETVTDSNMFDSRENSIESDATLTPKSSRSRGASPVMSRHKTKKKRFNRSILLRKSALLSHSSEHSGVISGVTLNNTYGFKNSIQNYQNARASVQHDYLTIIAVELHVNTRGDFRPNPQYDAIQGIFYCISNDVEEKADEQRKSEGFFAVSPISNETKTTTQYSSRLDGMGITQDVKYVENEQELFKEFTKFITDLDPDILIGYEIQMLSWGYLVERCFHLGVNIIPDLSRVKDKHLKFNEKETGDMKVTGRVVLDFWRLLRHEIALQSYTLQSTVYEILQKRIPKYSFKDLTTWWDHHTYLLRHRTVTYYFTLLRCQLKLLEQLDLVGRTSELARLFGIQFYEVLSRGSQFRVESMMLRLAKPMNYVAVSPSVQQRAKMKAPEHIALVLEPESKLYTDPVIVLDFQSLYPSIIIAYNYCFSTCVGRVDLLGKNEPFEFGASYLKVSKERIKFFLKKNYLNFSPCGMGFVNKKVRDGIMPRMLREILDTRLMVKKSMKENKEDAVLQKVLHNRQLGLKLIANVTYGYTAANFSGRMPSVELGDSIVSKARETLQRTIALVDGNREWGARVVYGDTDSLFVHCPGKSREEAFAIGEKIVEAVGTENPDPVKLKLEKVYQPCILQTKKRYVGYMYESPDQKEPVYDAKGIETVRRDGCPAVSKMLEKSLRILFETKDVSRVKKYCVRQFSKIILGRLSLQDLTFAKEYRGFTGYRPGACVPSLELAKKWVASDKRAEPRRGERVPYVIVNGPPGLPLIRLVRSPYELLSDPTLRTNALYYITRVIIPPLNRCFNLIGADLNHWFHEMPRKQLQYLPTVNSPVKKTTISQYFISTLCAVCSAQTQNGLCVDCERRPQETVVILNEKVRQWEAAYSNCKLICSTCTQILEEPQCISLDCPVLYRLHQTSRDLQQAEHIRQLLTQFFDI